MSDPDVVAELEAWLRPDLHPRKDPPEAYNLHRIVARARDEIVALRRQTEHNRQYFDKARYNIRAEALEEAAQACAGSGAIVAEACLCAAAIRALKDPP